MHLLTSEIRYRALNIKCSSQEPGPRCTLRACVRLSPARPGKSTRRHAVRRKGGRAAQGLASPTTQWLRGRPSEGSRKNPCSRHVGVRPRTSHATGPLGRGLLHQEAGIRRAPPQGSGDPAGRQWSRSAGGLASWGWQARSPSSRVPGHSLHNAREPTHTHKPDPRESLPFHDEKIHPEASKACFLGLEVHA